jgi:hypothetical protein
LLKSFIDFSHNTHDNNITSSPITSSPFNSSRNFKRPIRVKQKEITSDSSNNETSTIANINTKNKATIKPKELLVIGQQKTSSYDITDL